MQAASSRPSALASICDVTHRAGSAHDCIHICGRSCLLDHDFHHAWPDLQALDNRSIQLAQPTGAAAEAPAKRIRFQADAASRSSTDASTPLLGGAASEELQAHATSADAIPAKAHGKPLAQVCN